MVLFLTLVSALTSVAGNLTAKYWAHDKGLFWPTVTLLLYNAATIAYVYSLRLGGKFTVVNSIFYAAVPIITLVSGLLIFKERLTTLQFVGLALACVSVIFFVLEGEIVQR